MELRARKVTLTLADKFAIARSARDEVQVVQLELEHAGIVDDLIGGYLIAEAAVDVVAVYRRMEPQQYGPGERCADQEGDFREAEGAARRSRVLDDVWRAFSGWRVHLGPFEGTGRHCTATPEGGAARRHAAVRAEPLAGLPVGFA
jgi:hypothetical protein